MEDIDPEEQTGTRDASDFEWIKAMDAIRHL